ncbi:hypothetical protein FB00_11240 [Cellulosimicrobium funkei]|uniref:Head-to-tail adaptor n=1 Tax=Cellulosimicrobium funkei TaxID=264251 RepID=A0A0H2KRZ8_9MICO|nr:hypothetical protein [Cellulosimicrobium funkei]KLN34574.1 hypothetical protein FB00_11240 [Cellulosimicrobium funkei]
MFPDDGFIGWVPDFEYVYRLWPEAARMDEFELGSYLVAAVQQCAAFVGIPADYEGPELEERHLMAQVMQARALWRSGKAGDADQVGPDGFTVTVFPMDWTVKDLLRPKRPGSFYFGARS